MQRKSENSVDRRTAIRLGKYRAVMELLLVSPYHGGSHQAWAEGYLRHSQSKIHLLTLPARYWKWRMHGGAVTLARRFNELALKPNVLLATDMLDLTTFLALTRSRTADIPTVLYMHENQLTYPLPEDPGKGPMRRQAGERDLHYGFINYASMTAADLVLTNSEFHRRELLQAIAGFLRRFPEYRSLAEVPALESKTQVLPVGVDLAELLSARSSERSQPPLILWNQRWEYDKDPDSFFSVISKLADRDVLFQLALCGEVFERTPKALEAIQERLGNRIAHVGFAPRESYLQLLWKATLTISTALHEFFGIAILEAALCETLPFLPRRLSYPELIPEQFHHHIFYDRQEDLLERLVWALTHPVEIRELTAELSGSLTSYSWEEIAPQYDRLFEDLMAGGNRRMGGRGSE